MAKLLKNKKGFTLTANTLSKVVKDNAKDKIDIQIGDIHSLDFKPQFKVSRWKNEVNFSMRAQAEVGAIAVEEDGKIKYKGKDIEVHQYEKPDAGDDGGFEFEWVLKKKPKSNVLRSTIQSKGLNFFYQPEITDTEAQANISEGDTRTLLEIKREMRPENVLGSYAVYHSTKRNNHVGGMEYKTGKAFHIYRPHAVDSDGVKVWCELDITEGELTVTVPEDFLRKASYPVVVDPTLGYTSLGASGQSLGSYTSSSNLHGFEGNIAGGETNSVSVGLSKTSSFPRSCSAFIYSDPDTQLDVETLAVANATFAFYAYTGLGANVLTGNHYFVTRASNPNVLVAYDTSSGTAGGYIAPNPFGPNAWVAQNTRNYSVFVDYTAGAGGGAGGTVSSRKGVVMTM